jgi:hypothetical protein
MWMLEAEMCPADGVLWQGDGGKGVQVYFVFYLFSLTLYGRQLDAQNMSHTALVWHL